MALRAVVVDELTPGGNAANVGVKVGDVILEVSAYVLKQGKESEFESEGYGKRPYTNWEKTMVNAEGVDFDTVMSAIASNNERWGVRTVDLIVLRRRV